MSIVQIMIEMQLKREVMEIQKHLSDNNDTNPNSTTESSKKQNILLAHNSLLDK